MNFIILVSVISIGNSGVYGGSRTLTALAEQGYAPRFFAYIDKAGRPLWSTIAILLFGCLGYITLSANGPLVFDWLLALSGLAALFTWGSICLAHIRFRSAWKHQGHTLDEIPFKAVFGVYGSWAGLILIFLVLMAQVCLPRPSSSLCCYDIWTDLCGIVLHRPLPPWQRRQNRHSRRFLQSLPSLASSDRLLDRWFLMETNRLVENFAD